MEKETFIFTEWEIREIKEKLEKTEGENVELRKRVLEGIN